MGNICVRGVAIILCVVLLSSMSDKEKCVIETIGDVDTNILIDVYNSYKKIPDDIRNKFEGDGWKVILTTENIGKKYYGRDISLLAMTDIDEKVIYIANRDKAVKSIVHEMGHYIDYCSDYVSSSEEFKKIYEQERRVFCKLHSTHKNNTSTALEYFAEFYMVAVLDPDLVKDKCPKSYEFIMRVEDGICKSDEVVV